MPEAIQPLQIVLAHYLCDSCGHPTQDTNLIADANVSPPLRVHQCSNKACGATYRLPRSYPHQMLIPVGEMRIRGSANDPMAEKAKSESESGGKKNEKDSGGSSGVILTG